MLAQEQILQKSGTPCTLWAVSHIASLTWCRGKMYSRHFFPTKDCNAF